MSAEWRLDLSRPRDVGALLTDAFSLYGRNLLTFLGIAAAVVIPVNLIVSGIGLEQLTSEYDKDPPPAQVFVPAVVSYLVTAPLTAAMAIHAVLEAAAGRRPRAGRSIQSGLDVFAPVFTAILIAAIGISLGLLAFLVPGIILAVLWYFVPQAVVIDGRRGTDALRRSWELVRGSWWRVFGVGILATLIVAVPAAIIQPGLTLAADATDRSAFELLGQMLLEMIGAPFVAILATLLYFDLQSRRAPSAPPPVVPPPVSGQGWQPPTGTHPPEPPPAGEAPPPHDAPPDPPGLPPRG